MSECAACAELREQVATLQWRLDKVIEQHDLAEQDIAHKRRQIAALKSKLEERRDSDPGKEVQDIFDYWVIACRKDPKRTKLTTLRRDAIRKALREGYEVYDIQRAIMGIARAPFTKNGVTYDDITVACRKVELWRDKADAIENNDQQVKAAVAEQAKQVLFDNVKRAHYTKPELPALWSGGLQYFAHLLKLKGCRIHDGYGNRFRAQCPAHDGSNSQALSVVEADDGRVLAKCFVGCTWEDICSALGVESRIFGPRDHPIYGKPTDDGGQISFGAVA